MKKNKTIVICSSASFYEKVFPIKKDLEKLGFKVTIPKVAIKMKKANNFDTAVYKTWFKNPNDYRKKRSLMNHHFNKIIKGDAVLVANFDKNGIKGYIGGNVFMEITIAYHYKKPIFILNNIADDSLIKEEVYGVNPIFLKGNINNLL